mgnify:FL=1|tara:strand:+ start:481 stop:1551 length:1071 start_codon:yes stop_codon:yes gene_type:complete
MSLLDKLKKTSTVKSTAILSDSALFNKKDMVPTDVPVLNIALSGSIDGGLTPGLTVLAGPSKHFKSNLALLMAHAYMKKYPEAVCLLYDTEFGITPEYLESMGVDPARCIHTPIEHVEQLKFDITKQLEEIEKGDKVIIVIDSVGNLASKKELEDALDGKSVADMSRAKALKSLFRICTPYLTTRDIPLVAVNHTYKEIGMFPKDVMGGGTGIYYSANQILFMGRQQEKEGTEIAGYHFMMGVEKSRFVREKTRLPLSVTWEGGINKWSGLLDIGLELGWITKPSVGWFEGTNPKTGEVITDKKRKADTSHSEFWIPMFKAGFADAIKDRYAIGTSTKAVVEEDVSQEEDTAADND